MYLYYVVMLAVYRILKKTNNLNYLFINILSILLLLLFIIAVISKIEIPLRKFAEFNPIISIIYVLFTIVSVNIISYYKSAEITDFMVLFVFMIIYNFIDKYEDIRE